MNKRILLLSIAILSLSVMAQKKTFTLENLFSGSKAYNEAQPPMLFTAWWGETLLKREALQLTVLGGKNNGKLLYNLDQLNAALQKAGLPAMKSINGVTLPYGDKPLAYYRTAQAEFLYDWEQQTVAWQVKLPEGRTWEDWSPASRALAYNRTDNLYVLTAEGKELALSTDGSHDIVYGQSVHRNEWGINKGTFWSPDGMNLCFYRMDQSLVPDYPLVDITTRIASLAPTKYPMAGEQSHSVTIGVFNLQTQRTVWLELGDVRDQYFSGISWTPDSKGLILYNLNRDQNHLRMLHFDATTGAPYGCLMEETHPKYINPKHGVTFVPWNDDQFLYWSDQDGYSRLYLYSLSAGKTLRQVTDQRLGVVLDLVGFNAKTKSVIVKATGCSPIQHNLFSVGVEKDKVTLLDNGEGVHTASLSGQGQQIVDVWSAPKVRRVIDLIQTGNAKRTNLLTADDPWEQFNAPEITSGSIKAADGTTDLYYRLIKPVDFDPNKKYPAVVYVYGGPGLRNVRAAYGYQYRPWEIYMAQKGYVIFVLDNRGSCERGRDFENVTFRHLGVEEMKDQMQGVAFLKSLPYVDGDRLGVHGWSYGGFMTTNLILTYPDVFKVAVAGGPVIDWRYYEVMYGERYMDTPQQNPEGYAGSDLKAKAGNLKGRLMIVFGYNDPVCVPQHTLSFMRACADAGTHPDLFTYPNSEHNMTGQDRIHLHEHITRYFEDHLK